MHDARVEGGRMIVGGRGGGGGGETNFKKKNLRNKTRPTKNKN